MPGGTYAEKYGIDRWRFATFGDVAQDTTATFSIDGMTLCGIIRQVVEFARYGIYTLSIKADGVIYHYTFEWDGSFKEKGVCDYIYLGVSTNKSYIFPYIHTTRETLIEWVKLELGSVPTPYYPRHPADELQLCKRYCQHIDMCSKLSTIMVAASNRIDGWFSLDVPLRSAPTATFNLARIFANSVEQSGFTFEASTYSYINNKLRISAYKSNHGLSASDYIVFDNFVLLDAEL